MEYRRLGKSGLKVSEIGLGGNNFGRRVPDPKVAASVINHALDLGINFIDTADIYNQGLSEEFIGKALAGKRSGVIIASKCGLPAGEGPNDIGTSRYRIMRCIEGSLKRFQTDYVDLYYLHTPDVRTPIEETLRALDDLVRSGKVRYIGCSNFAAWELCEALWTSKVNLLESFAVIQSQYNILSRGIENGVVPCCQKYGVGVVPWGPLAGGFLTGKYQQGKPAPAGSRLSDPMPVTRRFPGAPSIPPAGPAVSVPILTDANYEKVQALQKYAEERNHQVGELAIAWLLGKPWISSVIAGATTPEQITANVTAAAWKLSPAEMDELDKK